MKQTLARLAALDVNMILPGHGMLSGHPEAKS